MLMILKVKWCSIISSLGKKCICIQVSDHLAFFPSHINNSFSMGHFLSPLVKKKQTNKKHVECV